MSNRLRIKNLKLKFKRNKKINFYLKKALRLMSNKQEEKIIIKRSKKGYHLFLWTRCYGDKFKIRSRIGDDKKHIAMDKLHRYARQTLFSKKIKYKIKRGKSIKK